MTKLDQPTIAFMVWLHDYWMEEDSFYGTDPNWIAHMYGRWTKEWLPALEKDHCGDCTNTPMPCARCHTESVIELSKKIHEAINS